MSTRLLPEERVVLFCPVLMLCDVAHVGLNPVYRTAAFACNPVFKPLLFRNINAMIKLETDMFEKFYNRMEPRDLMTEKQGSSLDLGQVQFVSSWAAILQALAFLMSTCSF